RRAARRRRLRRRRRRLRLGAGPGRGRAGRRRGAGPRAGVPDAGRRGGRGHVRLYPVPVMASRGRVSLVGAGPGDPGLMTVRAVELIAAADLILYDRLIPPTALAGARPE